MLAVAPRQCGVPRWAWAWWANRMPILKSGQIQGAGINIWRVGKGPRIRANSSGCARACQIMCAAIACRCVQKETGARPDAGFQRLSKRPVHPGPVPASAGPRAQRVAKGRHPWTRQWLFLMNERCRFAALHSAKLPCIACKPCKACNAGTPFRPPSPRPASAYRYPSAARESMSKKDHESGP
jgi:hypothetical protein